MKILVKFPTRSRPHRFFKVIRGYMDNQNGTEVMYQVNIDQDDETMNTRANIQALEEMGVQVCVGLSMDKVHAINRDLEKAPKWDILVLASDDMICTGKGWDWKIQLEMNEHFFDFDGVLWHSDGHTHNKLNTMVIMGKKYFRRFKYIYHPDYTSLFCDNEFMEVANKLGKQKYFPLVLFEHQHFSNGKEFAHTVDPLMRKNESYFALDREVYNKRKAAGFPLKSVK
jgi:hypothetical protein